MSTKPFLNDTFIGSGEDLYLESLSVSGAHYLASGGIGAVSIGTAVGNAALLRHESDLPGNFRIRITFSANAFTGYLFAVVAGSTAPSVTTRALFDPSRRFWVWSNGFAGLHVCAKNAAGNTITWTGAAWAEGTVSTSYGDFTQTSGYSLVVERSPDHTMRAILYDDDATVIVETDWTEVYGASINEETYALTGSPYTDEPFSTGYGFDGQQVLPCYYRLTGDVANVTVNDKLIFNSGGAEKLAYADFENGVHITGDFDIQVDFNQPTLSSAAGANRYLLLYLFDASDVTTYAWVGKYRSSTAHRYYFTVYVEGVSVFSGYLATTATSGILRIVRSGYSVTGYYWSGAAWVTIGSYASFPSGRVFPKLRMNSNAADNVFEFDNFTIEAGTIYLPNRGFSLEFITGYEIEIAAPEMALLNQIGFTETDFPTAWGGDSLEIVNAIRTRRSWDFDVMQRIGETTFEEDFLLVNTIGEAEQEAVREVTVYLDGEELRPGRQYTRIEISEDIDRTPNQISIDVADEALYRIKQMFLRSNANFTVPRIEVYVDGFLYDSYFWEDLKMSEEPRSTTWQMWGRNQAARLYMPFAAKITEVYGTTTRMNLMRSIIEACGLTLRNYLVADFTIPAGLLTVEEEYPMAILQRLAEADGAVVRSARGTDVDVRYRQWIIEDVADEPVEIGERIIDAGTVGVDYTDIIDGGTP